MTDVHDSKYRFLVKLDRSRAPRAFKGSQNLWREDISRLYRLLHRHAEALKVFEKSQREGREEEEDLPHLSIAIFGPSGSGKSSLLRTVAADVDRRDSLLPDLLKKNVVSLPVMDPTTWGDSDQFLYAFLAAALEEERLHQKKKQHGYPQGLSPVQLAFQEVNEYLRVVDEPERHDEHDPLGLSLQKLERHTSGLRLRSALADLVDALAKELGAKMVLLPVDDLDMAPKHLVKSIQTYQSFLTHPRLVPIFTFTDRMPEELLEVSFREDLKDKDKDKRQIAQRASRLSISEQLSVQFLARSFPVRNRIRLGPAPARVQRAMMQTGVGDEERMEVRELLTIASFLLFGHPDRDDSHHIRAALRPSTLRRQFQVVDAMTDCRLMKTRSPQLALMAGLTLDEESREFKRPRWRIDSYERDELLEEYGQLTESLADLKIEATWASIFNGASWSLMNVHRDTLRELGLFLEDLYSWSPKELRSVVLDNLLLQDRATRRTVVDRWFNRTDYRRSQVLSILAANIFRPWMMGEEPYGDESVPLSRQLDIEQKSQTRSVDYANIRPANLDKAPFQDLSEEDRCTQVVDRLSFSVSTAGLWFLNVALGFYLPQIMARDWAEVHPEFKVRERMGGNGWDLQNAPVNAARMADAKQEIYSFGMVVLNNLGFRLGLETDLENQISTMKEAAEPLSEGGVSGERWKTRALNDLRFLEESHADGDRTGPLLLRIWSCFGYSYGRYWSMFSLWRGLGFLGQVLELGWRESPPQNAEERAELAEKLQQLIRGHCLKGMVLGPLFSERPKEGRLLQGFPAWHPEEEPLKKQVEGLARQLVDWLDNIRDLRVFPFPAGQVEVGWRNCFVRRIHGEYILGALWPRLNASVLEEQDSFGAMVAQWRSDRLHLEELQEAEKSPQGAEIFRWTAATAANAWSDILLEYWRGCPGMLYLLLSCPAFYKSRLRFCPDGKPVPQTFQAMRDLLAKDPWLERLLRGERGEELWRRLFARDWKDGKIPGLVGPELLIERTPTDEFGPSQGEETEG